MESYSQNSNKLDFQHEARILNGIWLITALGLVGSDSNLLIVFYVQIMPDDFVMQFHRF